MHQGLGVESKQRQLLQWSLALFCVFFSVQLAWSAEAEDASRGPASVSEQGDTEYSFQWLDPDKKIYVLQNRKFQKANRLMISALVGRGITGTYKSSFNLDPRLSYYFTEDWGFELHYSKLFNSDSVTLRNLIATGSTIIPNIREITDHYGVTLNWSPWYAKINVFNQILYFDWFFSAGAGMVNLRIDTRTDANDPSSFVTASSTAFYLGTGHLFHVSRSFIIRMDILGTIYNAEAVSNSKNEESAWVSNFSFNLGVALKL